jgi:glycosyl transferase family 1
MRQAVQDARVCVPTWRAFNRGAFQCGLYEAQDVIAHVGDVELISVRAKPGTKWKENWLKNVGHHDPTGMLRSINPGLEPVRLVKDYELLVVVCQNLRDLLYLNAIENWKDRVRTSVCWLDEMWAYLVPGYKHWLGALEQFDHIFVSYRGTALPLSEALGRPCHWMPAGVDTLRFCPYPNAPERVIDVYSIGRRHEGIHNSLLGLAKEKEIFYLHDTLWHTSSAEPIDDQQHRDMYANVAKRSRFFLVAPGKIVPDIAGFQVVQSELGFRYYEGAAAGAMLLGQAPTDESFSIQFDWKDAVLEINPDGSDVVKTVRDLMAQPERIHAASQRNAEQSLLRHDWIYRWKTLYEHVGLSMSAGMGARIDRLKTLASTIGQQAVRD